MKNIFNLKFVESKEFFYFILFFNVVLLFFTRFYPSMDGPAHLYNSNIFSEILKGNQTIKEFYSINPILIPNWTSHFIMGTMMLLFPSWVAEKIFILLYVAGMAVSFRYLIRQINQDAIFLSVLIFPFIYSFLFHLGFYNYCFSFIFFFLALGFYLKYNSAFNPKRYIYLSLLLVATYFSNALIFGFLGLVLGLFVFYNTYETFKGSKDFKSSFRFGARKLLLLLLVSLPGLILLFIFFKNVTFSPSDEIYPKKELIKWINDARAFIVYDYSGDEILTEQYFHILIILAALSFVGIKYSKKFELKKADILFIPVLIVLVLYFLTPNGASAGMMSDRYCLILFVFGLLWVCARSVKTQLSKVLVLAMIVVHVGLLIKHLNGTIKGLDKNAQTISQSSQYINKNSVVLPVNLSDNWLEPHFSNYIGADKPAIILENYEASVGWFPVKFNSKDIPDILLGDKNSVNGITWYCNPVSPKKRQIDNILIYGRPEKLEAENWRELKEILTNGFKLVYNSDDNYVALYERIK